MKDRIEEIQVYAKIVGAWLTAIIARFLGGWDMWLKVLVLVVVLDFITGILKAIYLKKLSSDISFKGGIRKICIFIVVAVAVCMDGLFQTEILMRTLAIGYYIAHEGISILENVAAVDLPVPNKLKEILEQLKKDSDKTNGKE